MFEGAGGPQVLELKATEFRRIKELIYQQAGIDIDDGKQTLVASRLGKTMRKGGFRSYAEYMDHVSQDRTGASLIALIDSLTTNHTSFLREKEHFDFFAAHVLPGFRERPGIDVWCAASSSGEEPYSIVLTAMDAAEGRRLPEVNLLATDISSRVLDVARRGVYNAERLAHVPQAWLPRYFLKGQGQSSGLFQVKPEVKARIRFERLNLIEPFQSGLQLSAIFCRNVMIYFDRPTQQDLVKRLAACLEPGGYLFVGHSESLTGVEHSLSYVRPAVYRRSGAADGSSRTKGRTT